MFKIYYFTLILFFAFFSFSDEKEIQPVMDAQIKNDDEAAVSQQKISSTVRQTRQITQEYTMVLKSIDNARIYNEQIRKIIESQKKEKVSILQQIRDVKHTDKQIVPLMLEMLASLENFIRLDLPFLKEERMKRLSDLQSMMDRADVSTSEKYRRILEAYQIENEYGRTIEVYQGFQNIDGKDLTVNFLRLGRLSLIYQSLDKKKQAYWSQEEKKWISISSSFEKAVTMAFRIAQKQSAPNLVIAWLSAPTKISSVLKAYPVEEEAHQENLDPEKEILSESESESETEKKEEPEKKEE